MKTTILTTKKRQKTIAKVLGVSQPTVSYWLRGEFKPRKDKMAKLHKHFPELGKKLELLWRTRP